MDHTITTNVGLSFNFDDPRPEQVNIHDISVALGNCCRFAGHVRHYYSVAEHASLVRRLVAEANGDAAVVLAALHHDSHEAYLGDVPTPLKEKIKAEAPGVWEKMEGAINAAIAAKLGFDVGLFDHPLIRDADREALAFEAAVLKAKDTFVYGLDLTSYKTRAEAEGYVIGYPPEDAACVFWLEHKRAVHEVNCSDAT